MDDIYKKYALPVLQFKLDKNPLHYNLAAVCKKKQFYTEKSHFGELFSVFH
jgi:hypothetical protein